MALLTATGVSRRYGSRVALEPADVEVREGEALALVGPNGAGKSTLLAVLAGALAPTSGTVSTAGERVGWAPQRPALYRHLSPRENLLLFARLEGVPDAEAEAARLLAAVDLEHVTGQAGRLSVGTLQRLNIAVALVGEPELLLLDEPTAALDPDQRGRIWQVASRLREGGGAVVFSTHALDEVAAHATRVLALVGGRVAFAGTPAELAASSLLGEHA